MRASRSRASGLTLIEVTVAASLLALASLAFLTTLSNSIQLDHVSRERAWARDACRLQMETILAQPFSNLGTFNGATFDVGQDVIGGGAQREKLKPVPPATHVGSMTVNSSGALNGGDADCYKITVTASWLTASGEGDKAKVGSIATLTIVANVADH